MKTVRVISEFVDKYNPTRLYQPGEVVAFDDARAADMVARKLAEVVEKPKREEPKPEVKEEVKAETKTEEKPESEVKPKPVIAKPLKKGPKEDTYGTKKGK